MKLINSLFILSLLLLFGCGSKDGSSAGNPPRGPTVIAREDIEVPIDEKAITAISEVLVAYSQTWNTPGLDEVNKGVLVGKLLHELDFKELKINDARFVFVELEKSDAKINFRNTAWELLKRRTK